MVTTRSQKRKLDAVISSGNTLLSEPHTGYKKAKLPKSKLAAAAARPMHDEMQIYNLKTLLIQNARIDYIHHKSDLGVKQADQCMAEIDTCVTGKNEIRTEARSISEWFTRSHQETITYRTRLAEIHNDRQQALVNLTPAPEAPARVPPTLLQDLDEWTKEEEDINDKIDTISKQMVEYLSTVTSLAEKLTKLDTKLTALREDTKRRCKETARMAKELHWSMETRSESVLELVILARQS